MPNDPRNYGVIPLTDESWKRLYAVALYGAGASDIKIISPVILGMLVDGLHRFFDHLQVGNLCLGPLLLPDGRLAIRLGIFPTPDLKEPVWFTMAGTEQLDFTAEETAWAYEMAEQTGQAGAVEIPDPTDFENPDQA